MQSSVGHTCGAIFSVNKTQAMTKISVLRSEMCKNSKRRPLYIMKVVPIFLKRKLLYLKSNFPSFLLASQVEKFQLRLLKGLIFTFYSL